MYVRELVISAWIRTVSLHCAVAHAHDWRRRQYSLFLDAMFRLWVWVAVIIISAVWRRRWTATRIGSRRPWLLLLSCAANSTWRPQIDRAHDAMVFAAKPDCTKASPEFRLRVTSPGCLPVLAVFFTVFFFTERSYSVFRLQYVKNSDGSLPETM